MKKLCLNLTILIILVFTVMTSFWALNRARSVKEIDFESLSNRLAQVSLATANLVSQFDCQNQTNADLIQSFGAYSSNQFYINAIDQSIAKLDQLVEKTGLDKFSTNLAVEASVLSEAAQNAVHDNKKRKYKKKMFELEKQQQKADLQKYGEPLANLEKLVRKSSSYALGTEAQRIIDEYPNSYFAGKMVTGRVRAFLCMNIIEEAEKYYKMLVDNDLTDTVYQSSNAGIDLNLKFTEKYIKNKDWLKASQSLERLAENNSELHFYAPFDKYISVSEIVEDLQQQIDQK